MGPDVRSCLIINQNYQQGPAGIALYQVVYFKFISIIRYGLQHRCSVLKRLTGAPFLSLWRPEDAADVGHAYFHHVLG